MGELGNSFGLAVETLTKRWIGRQAGGQDLDGDITVEARVTSAIDLTHAAGTERRLNLVGSELGAVRQH
jgi:hypothetical protein